MVVRGKKGMQGWQFRASDGHMPIRMHSQHAAGTRTLFNAWRLETGTVLAVSRCVRLQVKLDQPLLGSWPGMRL